MGYNEFLVYRGNGFEVISVKPRPTPQERFSEKRGRIRRAHGNGGLGDLTKREQAVLDLRIIPDSPLATARELGDKWGIGKFGVERIEQRLNRRATKIERQQKLDNLRSE